MLEALLDVLSQPGVCTHVCVYEYMCLFLCVCVCMCVYVYEYVFMYDMCVGVA